MDTFARDKQDPAPSAGQDVSANEAGLIAELPDDALIILPVRRMVLFPGATVPIAIGRPKSIAAIEVAIQAGRPVGVVMQREAEIADPGPDDLFKVGTLARIIRHMPTGNDVHHVICEGLQRIRLKEFRPDFPFLVANYAPIKDTEERSAEIDARFLQLKERALEALGLLDGIPQEFINAIAAIDRPSALADLVAQHMDLESQEKQEILETADLKTRLDRMIDILGYRIEVLKLSQDIGRQTQEKLSAQQREHILREQLQEIRRELGETDGSGAELAQLKADIEAAGMPDEARVHALKDLARLERIPEASMEYGMVRTNLETLAQLPWRVAVARDIDIAKAREILDEDHFGLEKIKQRILEFLAVHKLNPEGNSPILCFVGPPGVGKTSLGQSIARAMGRDFARLSLGGVHDEAEIRGHRMTYVGAMPGNIIKTLQRTGSRDCVLMLDEMDKMGASAHGDPASAMLEVLDPAQNNTFRDNYLGVPFDLSKIVFIATANVLEAIARPLRDRMEVIELAGYTAEEKLEIARQYLVKRQLAANGLKASQCRINKSALKAIIDGYTREAGVRNLEREIGAVARRVAIRIAEGKADKVSVNEADVHDILGPPRFKAELALRTSSPGVATGLAWTPVGGDILFIEATKFKGNGKLILTGQLGDVMRESAQAALSLVKARAAQLKIDPDVFGAVDLHIHLPAGAIPKDGPSAGVALFIALVSLFKDECVRSDTAMTGEISLRGLVLPVGGIKEKVIAAQRAGVKRVMLPAENQRDFDEIPESVRKRLEFIWLQTVDDAIGAALKAC
jgi:ATP-dependent Lon protease